MSEWRSALERGLEMMVAAAGDNEGGRSVRAAGSWRIRRSGCSYMVEDSAPVVLLTQRRMAERFREYGPGCG